MNIEELLSRIKPRRKVHGIAAALLPLNTDGSIAVDSFQQLLRTTKKAGLTNAVNMDTGYVNLLSQNDQQRVLDLTREALGPDVEFIAGAYVEGVDGDLVSLYRQRLDQIFTCGGRPIIFQTARLHSEDWRTKVATYREICRDYEGVLAFELGKVFAANGEIFDDQTVRGLMEIPALIGLKHSSLDRRTELDRLALRDKLRPDFRIYTGNDLAINMIEFGSDYLLGLATLAPAKFAERDRLWELGDPRYYDLADALQHLGNVAFRPPIPAYKHSAAVFLNITGQIPHDNTHPQSPKRPIWEPELMRECAQRLELRET